MDNELADIFIQEAEDNLLILENRIIGLEENPDDSTLINDAFRAIHSIKGGAGLAGFMPMQKFSHAVEDLFEQIRSGKMRIEKHLITDILDSMDILRLMTENIRAGADADKGIETGELLNRIKADLNQSTETAAEALTGSSENASHYYYLKMQYDRDIFTTGIDPLMFITDLEQTGTILSINTLTGQLPDRIDFDPEYLYLEWELFFETTCTEQDIKDVFCFVIDESNIDIRLIQPVDKSVSINGKFLSDFISLPDTQAKSNETKIVERRSSDRRSAVRNPESIIRVPTDKLERIFNTVSELLISQARLGMLNEEYEEILPESFSMVSDSLKNISLLLQEQITSLRMLSLSSTFDRFKRVVRDIAAENGKKIILQISGQDTELDKNMIEKLNDPLKHLVRNCIDHGIETEADRLKAGKSAEGLLTMSAFLENGKVVLEVSDDGRGINRTKLLNKAIEKELILPDTQLSDGEILNLIFHPGLSTAESVTDLSGRGVGMDVVKSTINELHGNIDIISTENTGTTFRLNLPLTLAILDGMLISVGREKYIIPTLSILEIFRPERELLKSISGGKEVVFFRGEYISILRLHEVFGIENSELDPVRAELIVVNSGGLKAAVLVDNVIDQYQIVLKSLEKNFKKVKHISSATILGDGDVALIIDMASLIHFKGRSGYVQKV